MSWQINVTNHTDIEQKVVLFGIGTSANFYPTGNSGIVTVLAITDDYEVLKSMWKKEGHCSCFNIKPILGNKPDRIFLFMEDENGNSVDSKLYSKYPEDPITKEFPSNKHTCIWFMLPANSKISVHLQFKKRTDGFVEKKV